jgi:hypothetical protein
VGTCLMKTRDSATIICTKAFIIYIRVTVLATSPCLHLMNNHSYPRCHCFHVDHHRHYIAIRVRMYSNVVYDIWNNPVSFPLLLLDIFNMFPVPLLVIHTCCDVFSMSLFNLGSLELYRFRSHVWRQSNCMTMISQYVITFAQGLIIHYTLPAEPYHA